MRGKKREMDEMIKSVVRALKRTSMPTRVMYETGIEWNMLQTIFQSLEEEKLVRCEVVERVIKGGLSDNPTTRSYKRYYLTDKGVEFAEKLRRKNIRKRGRGLDGFVTGLT